MDSSDIFSLLACLAYAIATFSLLLRFFNPQGPKIKFTLSAASLAIVFHGAFLSQSLFIESVVNFSLPNVISLVSIILAIAITTIASRVNISLLLPVVYGFAGLWQLLLIFIPQAAHPSLSHHSLSMNVHIVLALIAYCILVIATLYAFQVSYINMKLKSKKLKDVSFLPPLMQVENQLFVILSLGTLGLLLSQLSGVIFIEHFISKHTAHKTTLSFGALLLYALTLWGHYQKGWRGHRVQVLTLSATTLLTLAYFGSRFVKEFLIH